MVDGAWCALVSHPDLGLAAALDAGVDPSRCVMVPDPGSDAGAVLGAVADGFDVVVVGACTALSDRDRRALSQRVRHRGARGGGGDAPAAARALQRVLQLLTCEVSLTEGSFVQDADGRDIRQPRAAIASSGDRAPSRSPNRFKEPMTSSRSRSGMACIQR